MITLCIDMRNLETQSVTIGINPKIILLYLPETETENVQREALIAQVACEAKSVEEILEILR